MVLRLYVHIDETQSLFLAFDLYIIILRSITKTLRDFPFGMKPAGFFNLIYLSGGLDIPACCTALGRSWADHGQTMDKSWGTEDGI